MQQVSALQGQLLTVVAKMISARSILELGTLGGFSAIHLARALPADGRLVTLESSPRHAAVAVDNIAKAGFADRVEVIVGEALDTLPKLADRSFDLVFIDADKANNEDYLRWSLKLTHPGSVIIADNVVRGGDVLDAGSIDPSVVGTRRFADVLGARAPGGGNGDPDRRGEGLRRLRARPSPRPLARSLRRRDAPATSRPDRARRPHTE